MKKISKYARPVSQINERERIPSQIKAKSRDGKVSPIIRLKGDLQCTILKLVFIKLIKSNLTGVKK